MLSRTKDSSSDESHCRESCGVAAGKRIRRSATGALGKPVRLRDKEHRKFVLRQPCLVCGRVPSDPHHLTFTQPRALGRRVSDEFTVPVCRSTIASFTARGMRSHGGAGSTLIRFRLRSSFGSTAGPRANCSVDRRGHAAQAANRNGPLSSRSIRHEP